MTGSIIYIFRELQETCTQFWAGYLTWCYSRLSCFLCWASVLQTAAWSCRLLCHSLPLAALHNMYQNCYYLQTLELGCLQPSLCDLEFELSRYAAYRIHTQAASRRLIVEIDGGSMGNTKLAPPLTQHSELLTEVRRPWCLFSLRGSEFFVWLHLAKLVFFAFVNHWNFRAGSSSFFCLCFMVTNAVEYLISS